MEATRTTENVSPLGAATGLIALGASVLLGGLGLTFSASGPVAWGATLAAHAGLLCVVVGNQLIRRPVDVPSSVRRSYLVLAFALVLCTGSADLAIIGGL